MSKEELIQFEGLVIEILPDARYRVQLDAGYEVVAYTAGKMKKNRIKTLVGDRVTIEMSPYDLQKGRWSFVIRTNIRGRAPVRPCAISFGVADARLSAAFGPDARSERDKPCASTFSSPRRERNCPSSPAIRAAASGPDDCATHGDRLQATVACRLNYRRWAEDDQAKSLFNSSLRASLPARLAAAVVSK
jgi:translation initiation factor IF-1